MTIGYNYGTIFLVIRKLVLCYKRRASMEITLENVSTIKYNTTSSFELLDYMYKDCNVYLDRKFALYKQVTNVRKTR